MSDKSIYMVLKSWLTIRFEFTISYRNSTLLYKCGKVKVAFCLLTFPFSTAQSLSHVRLCHPMNCSNARPPCPSPAPGVYPNSCPSSQWCHPAISSCVIHFSSCPQSFPASGSFPMSQLFASAAKVPEFQLQPQSFQWTPRTDLLQDGLAGSPCSPRDSQDSSPTPQLKSIISSVLSFLYNPALTSIQYYWKNHSFD